MAQRENFTDRPGGDYRSFQTGPGGASECSTSCATDARCRAYTYVTASHMCFEKETVPAPVASNCCFSGIKLMGAPEYSTDRPGSDIQVSDSPSPQSCETDCRNEPACQAYSWVRAGVQGPTARCWLKKAKPAKTSNSCCTSGVRLPPPRRLPAEVLIPHAPAATR
jgi:hypothetical protein